MPLLQLLYLIPIIAALALCLRHRSLSQYMPLLIGGFGANLTVLILNTATTLLMRLSMGKPSFPSIGQNIYPITSLLSLGSWALIACGLGFVLNDIRQKLQCLDTMTQSGWNYNPNHQNPNRQQNSQAYSQNAFSQNSFQQHREETHASPITSASAPMSTSTITTTAAASSVSSPVAVESAPTVPVRAGEPDAMLPLGSSHS